MKKKAKTNKDFLEEAQERMKKVSGGGYTAPKSFPTDNWENTLRRHPIEKDWIDYFEEFLEKVFHIKE